MKSVEQYFPVVPFVMLYKVILTFDMFESVGDVLKCDHSELKLLSVTQRHPTTNDRDLECSFLLSHIVLWSFKVVFARANTI